MNAKQNAQKIVARVLKSTASAKPMKETASAGSWFDSLSPAEQKKYLKAHPNSEMGKKARAGVMQATSRHMAAHSAKLQPHPEHVKHLKKIAGHYDKIEDGPGDAKHLWNAYNLAKKGPPKVGKIAEHPAHKGMSVLATKTAQRVSKQHADNARDSDVSEEDVFMTAMDQADHLKLAHGLHTGVSKKRLNEHMEDMDTAPRDDIHSKVRRHIGNVTSGYDVARGMRGVKGFFGLDHDK